MKNLKRIASVFILMRRIALVFLLLTLTIGGLSAQAQQRRSSRRSTSNRPFINSQLTGTYRLDTTRGDDARAMSDRATINLPQGQRERVQDNVMRRLEAPDMLAIEQNGRNVSIASSRAARITFDADGQERSETMGNGRTLRTRATLQGDRLEVSTTGNRSSDFSVTFEPLDNGRSLRVTRRIYSDRLDQPIVVQSFYDRTSNIAQWSVYDGQQTYPGTREQTTSANFIVRDGTRLVAVLNNELTTGQTRERDPFTLTVREPAEYAGATINGYVSQVGQSGRVTGRSGMTLNFETIQLRNGRTYSFAGLVNSVRTNDGENIRVDNEGSVESSNQTEKTGVRTAVGTGIGAIIGTIAGGGKGAAIGAIVGAGAGAGSVYVQGRENLELRSGTELTIQASSPVNNR
jgi:hypothetical protein